MSKFSKINRPQDTKVTYISESRDFRKKRDRALSGYPITETDRVSLTVLDGRVAGLTAFVATNARGQYRFARAIFQRVQRCWQEDPTLEFLHITIIDAAFDTSDEQTTSDIRAMTAQARDILDAIAPNWIAGVDFAVFANRVHPLGGKVISPHVHATVWDPPDIIQRAEQVARRYNDRLATGVAGCQAVDVKPVRSTNSDLGRVVTYPYHPPVRAKTVYHNPKTGHTNLHESEKGDRYVRFLRMCQILSLMEQDHLCFASGAGVGIRRSALARVHRRLEQITHRSSRADQMDWIQDFWSELLLRIGLTRFLTPVILMR